HFIHHNNRFNEDIRTWFTDHPAYMFLDHGLHYFDVVRWHTGLEPTAVSALARRAPHQNASCPLMYVVIMRFGEQGAPLVSLVFNNAAPAPEGFVCDWYFDGSSASAHLTLDTIRRMTPGVEGARVDRLEGGWVPDGFYGAYRALVSAVESGVAPPHGLRD